MANPRQTGRAYRRKQEIRTRKRLYELVSSKYCPTVGHLDCAYVDKEYKIVGNHVKRSSHSHTQKFIKTRTSHMLRQSVGKVELPPKGNHYRKLFVDYFFTIF